MLNDRGLVESVQKLPALNSENPRVTLIDPGIIDDQIPEEAGMANSTSHEPRTFTQVSLHDRFISLDVGKQQLDEILTFLRHKVCIVTMYHQRRINHDRLLP